MVNRVDLAGRVLTQISDRLLDLEVSDVDDQAESGEE